MGLPLLVWLLLSLIWGSTWLVIKVGLQDLPTFTFAGLRFVIAIIPLLALMGLRRRPLPESARDWRLIALTGVLTFSINYGLVFWAENYISSGLTAILYTTLPLFGLILAHFQLSDERVTAVKVFGVLLGIGGVTLIFSNQLHFDNPMVFWGALAVLISALGTAYATILIKAHGKHLDPLVLTASQMVIGVVPLLVIGALFEGNPLDIQWTPTAWFALFYLALVGSSLTFVLLYWLIQNMEVTRTHLMPLASTLIAVILGYLILDEKLSGRAIVGGIAIMAGLVVTSFRPGRVRTPRV